MSALGREDIARLIRRGRKAEARAEVIGKLVKALALWLAVLAIEAWELMLAIGMVHGWLAAGLPTLGYWQCLALIVILRGVAPGIFTFHRKIYTGGTS